MPPPTAAEIVAQIEAAPAPEKTPLLRALAGVAQSEGLALDPLSTVFGWIFDSSLTALQKNLVLAEVLVPRADYVLPPAFLSRVLAAVGAPEVVYKNGKQHKSKRLSMTTQGRLLGWLLAALPHFGRGVHALLRRHVPLLVGLLPYEFSRPHIASLVVLATAPAARAGAVPALRPWHVQKVADLQLRFPLDPAFKMLLLHFCTVERTLDLRRYYQYAAVPTLSVVPGVIGVPASAIRDTIAALRKTAGSDLAAEFASVSSQLDDTFRRFSAPKRCKVDPAAPRHDAMDVSSDSSAISRVDSMHTLVAHFESIAVINPSSAFSVTSQAPYLSYYLTMRLLACSKADPLYKKLESALKYHILTRAPQTSIVTMARFLDFCAFGGADNFEPLLRAYLAEKIESANGTEWLLHNQLALIPYSAGPESPPCLQTVLENTHAYLADSQSHSTVLAALFEGVSLLVKKLWDAKKLTAAFLEALVPELFSLADRFWAQLTLAAKLSFTAVLASLALVDCDFTSTWENAAVLVPGPGLMYRLVISTNPIIMSEGLGYIAFLKGIRLAETQVAATNMKNAYVMDAVNFVWRDMAFKSEEGTFSKGMFLHGDFLQRMAGLNFFSNSDLVSIKSIGGIVQNPSLAYICAELVWRIEDAMENISTRHPGPLSEATVAQLHQDPEITWLPKSYYEIKLDVLNSLDALGLTGLCNLLFSSLKPLAGKREKTA